MQPHSLSALAVGQQVFGENYGEKIPDSAEVQIDWRTPEGKTRSIFHYISAIEISKQDRHGYITELRVSVRTTDGTPCTLTIRRLTDGPFKQGEKVVATHSVQHVAGLEERYEIDRRSIRGEHYNSRKYGRFLCTSANESSFVLNCQVRSGSNGNFVNIPYTVKIKPRGEKMTKELIEKKREEEEKKNKILYPDFTDSNQKAA